MKRSGEKYAIALIDRYYAPGTLAHRIFSQHARQVADKALAVAARLQGIEIDASFLKEASLLHDIGVYLTHAPEIGCEGSLPYLMHGIMGREILEQAGLDRHALVCERHIGIGLTAQEIRNKNLPLPARDMVPVSLEEKIITYADLFFSKTPGKNQTEKSADQVRRHLDRYGHDKVTVFNRWHDQFGE